MKKLTTILAASLMLVGLAGCGKQPVTYSVTYDGNYCTSGVAPKDDKQYAAGSSVTALTNSGNLERYAYTFDGWNTAADGTGTDVAVGASFKIEANTVLYAKWFAIDKVTVTYNANGATGTAPVDSTQYVLGETITVRGQGDLAKKNPSTGADLVFKGWNTAADGSGKNYKQEDTIVAAENLTLFAIFEAKAWNLQVEDWLRFKGMSVDLTLLVSVFKYYGAQVSVQFVFDAETGEEYAVVDAGVVTASGSVKTSDINMNILYYLLYGNFYAVRGFDQSMYNYGYLYFDTYDLFDDNGNTCRLEFNFIDEGTLYALFYGAVCEVVISPMKGVSAADASEAFAGAVAELGAEESILIEDDLSEMADFWFVEYEYNDPAAIYATNAYNLGLSAEKTWGINTLTSGNYGVILNMPVANTANLSTALGKTQTLLATGMGMIIMKKGWIAANAEGTAAWSTFTDQYDKIKADVTVSTLFNADETIKSFQAKIVFTLLDEDARTLLGVEISTFDLDGTLSASFIENINTDSYTINNSVEELFGTFVFGNDPVNADGEVISGNFATYYSNFRVSVEVDDKPLGEGEWPKDEINTLAALTGASFDLTNLPTMEFDLAFKYEKYVTDEDGGPYVTVVALDVNYDVEGERLQDMWNLLMEDNDDWVHTTYEHSQVGTMDIYTSVAESALQNLVFYCYTYSGQFIIEYHVIDAPQLWTEWSDEIAAFIAGKGFTGTELPASTDGEKIWYLDEDEDGEYIAVYCEDEDGSILKDYVALFEGNTQWTAPSESSISIGYYTVTAYASESVEIASGEKDIVLTLMIYNYNGTTIIEVSTADAPILFPAAQFNQYISDLGIADTVVPELTGNYHVEVDEETGFILAQTLVNGAAQWDELVEGLDENKWDVEIEEDAEAGTKYLIATSKTLNDEEKAAVLEAMQQGSSLTLQISNALTTQGAINVVNNSLEEFGWDGELVSSTLAGLVFYEDYFELGDITDDDGNVIGVGYNIFVEINEENAEAEVAQIVEDFNTCFAALGCTFEDCTEDDGCYYWYNEDGSLYVVIDTYYAEYGYLDIYIYICEAPVEE